MVNIPFCLINLKTKVDYRDVAKLRTVPNDLKKLRDVVSKEVDKNMKFNRLNTRVKNLEREIPDATTLIHVSQCNTDKQGLEKKLEMLIKNT